MPVGGQKEKPHLRVVVAASTTTAAHAGLQKLRKWSTCQMLKTIVTFLYVKQGESVRCGEIDAISSEPRWRRSGMACVDPAAACLPAPSRGRLGGGWVSLNR